MACRSASVQRAQRKSQKALTAIKRLEEDIEKLAKSEKKDFEEKISNAQTDLEVDDLKPVGEDFAIKVDFTHEFNADALIPVISNVINAAAGLIAGTSAVAILTNPDNIKTYADLLGSIAEAIKTKSTTGGNTSFSMNRLAPGFFSFTSSKAMTISDKETFGDESITATVFQYSLYFSEKHAIKMNKWTTTLSILDIIRKLNEARIGLVDRLMNNEFSLAVFQKLADEYKVNIEKFESELSSRVNEHSVVNIVNKVRTNELIEMQITDSLYNQDEALNILNNAQDIFGSRGSLYSTALKETKELFIEFE